MLPTLKDVVDKHSTKPPPGEGNYSKVSSEQPLKKIHIAVVEIGTCFKVGLYWLASTIPHPSINSCSFSYHQVFMIVFVPSQGFVVLTYSC